MAETSSSFSKLKKLRAELCKSKSNHDTISKIRVQLISELISTRSMIENSEAGFNTVVIDKINSMISLVREDMEQQ